MNSNDFVVFAKSLADESPGSSARFRSAVSRAYYGAFNYAAEIVNSLKCSCPHGRNEHEWVRQCLDSCSIAEAKEASQLLRNLHESRKDADYHLGLVPPETQLNAQFCVARAEKIAAKLNACISEGNRDTVRSEMLAYKKLIQGA
jgi:hypothetical protein